MIDAVRAEPAVAVTGDALTLTNFQAPLDIDFGDVAVGETRVRRFGAHCLRVRLCLRLLWVRLGVAPQVFAAARVAFEA